MLQWYNLIFELGFAALLLYAFVMGTGILGGVDDLHAEAHHEFHAGDHDAHAEHDHDGGLGFRGMLGIGKVPVSIIFILLLLFWSGTGLIMNGYLRDQIAQNRSWVWVSVAAAVVVAVSGTALLSRVIARVMPTNESYVTKPEELVGKTAEVLYDVTEQGGTARVADRFNNLLDIDVKAALGTGPFKRGQSVQIRSLLPGTRTYLVGAVTGTTNT